MGVQAHFKGNNTIHNLLMFPKDKNTITQMSEAIYRFKCTKADSEQDYNGESGRTFGDRLKEHLMALFPIYEHSHSSRQCNNVDSFSIVE